MRLRAGRRLLALASLLLVAVPGYALAQARAVDPPIVLQAFERARANQDVAGALAQFSDEAVITLTVDGRQVQSYTGNAEIRRFLETVVVHTRSLILSNRHVVGSHVTWSERITGQRSAPIDVQVDAVVQDGKIQSLAYRTGLGPAQADGAEPGPGPLPAGAVLGGLLLAGSGLILLASLGAHRPTPGSSRLQGRLIAGLACWQRHA